jgi:hypothetical protein
MTITYSGLAPSDEPQGTGMRTSAKQKCAERGRSKTRLRGGAPGGNSSCVAFAQIKPRGPQHELVSRLLARRCTDLTREREKARRGALSG